MKNNYYISVLLVITHTHTQISLSSLSIIVGFDQPAINRRFARPFVRSSTESEKSIRASVELKACTASPPAQ